MAEYTQLVMRARLDNLPPLELPHDLSLSHVGITGKHAWEHITDAAFGGKHSFAKMEAAACYSPDRVIMIKDHSQCSATASAYYEPNDTTEGYLHMVAGHPLYTGMRAGYWAVLAAMHRFKEDGMLTCRLKTDDFRLPAIARYLELGFEPVMAAPDHEERWQKVRAQLAAYKKPEKQIMRLWEGDAPYTQEGQAQPVMFPFPAKNAKSAVLVCPGGGYHHLSTHEGPPVARMFREAGISGYVLHHRFAPCHHEAPLADVSRAVRILRHMGYEKIAVLGFSAGGHLAACAGTLYTPGNPDAEDPIERYSSRPDAFIPCYAVISFYNYPHMGCRRNLLGEQFGNTDLAIRFSAELNVTPDTPPCFLWHAADDKGVSIEHSVHLALALRRHDIPHELHIFPEGGHGQGLALDHPHMAQWGPLCCTWLKQLGFGE